MLHIRLPCPSLSPRVCSISWPLCRWCHPTISSSVAPVLLPSIFPSSGVVFNELALHIRWSKHWNFSFSIRPSSDYLGLTSFRIDWFDLLAVQGALKSLLQHTIWKHLFFSAQPSLWCNSHIRTYSLSSYQKSGMWVTKSMNIIQFQLSRSLQLVGTIIIYLTVNAILCNVPLGFWHSILKSHKFFIYFSLFFMATSTDLHLTISHICHMYGEGNGTPLQYSCLKNPMDGGTWWAEVHGIAELDTTERLHFHFSLSCIGEGNGNPLQCSCLENPRDSRAWWAAVHGVAQSWTRLKQLSSSSNSHMFKVQVKKEEGYGEGWKGHLTIDQNIKIGIWFLKANFKSALKLHIPWCRDCSQLEGSSRRVITLKEDVASEEDLEAGDNPSRQAGVRGIPSAIVVQAKWQKGQEKGETHSRN